MKKRRPSHLESTAYHEAGHAVVGHLLGWRIDGISIIPSSSSHGHTFSARQPAVPGVINKGERPDAGPLAEWLPFQFAGVVAERFLCTRSGVSSKPVRLGNDIRVARSMVRDLPKEERDAFLHSAEEHAMKLLSNPSTWQILEKIAEELLKLETLDNPSLLAFLLSLRGGSTI